jgi:hypothetical protein
MIIFCIMQPVLILSSIFLLVLPHVLALCIFGCPHVLLWASYAIGPATSLINHGTKSSLAEVFDRLAMIVGFAIDMYYVISIGAISVFAAIGGSIACYAAAKGLHFLKEKEKGVALHVLCHVCVTVAHGRLLQLLLYTSSRSSSN